ncbi:hypothetical protein AMJ57_04735 [Parcubacteria bacterium SG8_24]|nr:MAG: hypothetical protein AMJ57_04735 [Parcubacteria bacterium SG8_24]
MSWYRIMMISALTSAPALAGAKGDDEPPAEPTHTIHVVTADELVTAKKRQLDIYSHLFGRKSTVVKRFNRRDSRFVRAGTRLRVPEIEEGEDYVPLPARHPAAVGHDRYILVVLDRQWLGLYEPNPDGTVTDRRTPTGAYRIFGKDEDHVSSKYPEPDGGSPMPWGLQFTADGGYWVHGGDMVGYPASHGCVRMFAEDARDLFGRVQIGTPLSVIETLD